jgi:hypothetical protein
MDWHRTSNYSVACGPYAVSHATVLEFDTGELADRYSAWCGLDLLEQPRETSRPAKLLGIRRTAAEAKALCEAHLAANPQETPSC